MVPVASPISANVLVAKVLVTVKVLVGASSSPSWASRAASVVGYGADQAVTTPVPVLVTDVAVICVSPANSLAAPVTSTASPSAVAAAAAPKTKMPSEALGVASVPSPVPAVWM